MVDFAIVGAAKSGTTALAEFLRGHPGICMSVPKEPAYFAIDLREESDRFHGAPRYFEFRTEEDYAAVFTHCRPGALRGDASTAYLHSHAAAANLYKANPDVKIVVLLREPVSFMHSLHTQFVNETTEDEPEFARALEKEAERRAGRSVPARVRCPSFLFYRERARYAEHLQRYLAVFPREQILVLAFEEFQADNEGHFRRVLEFLGADASYAPPFREVHGSNAPRSRRLNRALNTPALKRTLFRTLGPRRYDALRKSVARVTMRREARPGIPPELERDLRLELAPEVDRVSALVGRDLRTLWGYPATTGA
jgi:Sulfotransferase domain